MIYLNASLTLNVVSLGGIVLILFSIASVILNSYQIKLLTEAKLSINPRISTILSRCLLIPIGGFIFLSEGWRLDPTLQFCVVIIIISLIYSVIDSYKNDEKLLKRVKNKG